MLSAIRNPWLELFVSCWVLGGCAPQSESRPTRPPLIVTEPPPQPEHAEPTEPPASTPAASESNLARVDPDALVGIWSGIGTQNDGQQWKIVVTLESTRPGRCGRVEYPSLPCSGDWICADIGPDGELRATEQITTGRDRCIDGGTMQMRLTPDGSLDWSWQGSGITASSLLQRSDARK